MKQKVTIETLKIQYTPFFHYLKNEVSMLNKALRRIMRDCNEIILDNTKARVEPVLLPRFSCHSLRHTFATRMCESGINIKVIQDVLGHADITTTMNIYTDATKELKDIEFDKFGNFFESSKSSSIIYAHITPMVRPKVEKL